MKQILELEKWNGLEADIGKHKVSLIEGKKAVYDFPHTEDVRRYEALSLDIEEAGPSGLWLEVILKPLHIGRPEFLDETSASVLLPPADGSHIEVPFSQFNCRHMADAFFKYISRIEIVLRTKRKQKEECRISVKQIALSGTGDFHASTEISSKAGQEGETVCYKVMLENEKDTSCYVTIGNERYGKEIISFEYPGEIVLAPLEKRQIEVKAYIPARVPKGGREKHVIEFIPDGDGSRKQRIELFAARIAEHPFLLHKESGWKKLQRQLERDGELRLYFEKTYEKTAKEWRVPAPYTGAEYVYPSASQDAFLETVIAWKLTADETYLEKILQYLRGLLDDRYGYLATFYSYFIFVESEKEYVKGDFKVHRACSAGWVQEGEFMTKLAIAYDLLYDHPAFTGSMHEKLEKCMRSYMDFVSWRITDGDGNNFQIAEASAALYCAFLLQDYEMICRFLEGKNGLWDLIASVLWDDGSYFEGAAGYMRLAAELFLRAGIACENFGVSLKDMIIPAAFDVPAIHSPWALRRETAEDGKPFLGMSFERFIKPDRPVRRLKDYFDNLLLLLNPQGILFSVNDSNEQNFIPVMEMAYYLYRDERYLAVTKLAGHRDLLFGSHMTETVDFTPGVKSCLNSGNGFAVLRDCRQKERTTSVSQAVLKFGQHGGYHGHYDRLSLVSFFKDNQTFHNMEYAWYGYDSFLFKMWVQTSVSHNMVVVDGRMQEPSACECVYFEDNDEFHAACAQTVSRWCDPPYGGQTPYPVAFPDEKCRQEGRYILAPDIVRKQGDIGEYSGPVFQRRLLVLADGCCFIWDYEEAEEIHTYDCLFHPMGKVILQGMEWKEKTERFDRNPYGAGQFIMSCHWYEGQGTVKLIFENNRARVNPNDIIDFVSNAELYRIYPQSGRVMVGRYPERQDTFEEEKNLKADTLEESGKKTVSFRQAGKTAKYITALEIGSEQGSIREITCNSYEKIVIYKKNGSVLELSVSGMDKKDSPDIRVTCVSRHELN